jgi:threonine synthase
MSVWRFADFLPSIEPQFRLTLGEGNTPLISSRSIGPSAGLDHLLLKVESSNPTGSYKDRFAAMAISAMLAADKRKCIATSSGNSGAALAAYCAAAGVDCEVAIVETAPLGKLQQMLAYGARLRRVRGFGVDAAITQATCERLENIGNTADASLQITAYRYSPIGMRGVESISFELAECATQRGAPINHVFVPAGGGGLALAVARGFQRMVKLGALQRSPAVHVVQPEGNDTIASSLRLGRSATARASSTTTITGLQVPSILDGNEVIAECGATDGSGYVVSDEIVWETQQALAAREGIYCEPAGAVALCGALQAIERGEVNPRDTIACLVTGHAFKDPTAVERMVSGCTCPMIDCKDL